MTILNYKEAISGQQSAVSKEGFSLLIVSCLI